MKRIFKILALSLLTLLVIIVTRALLHTPETTSLQEAVDYSLDEDLMLAHLSESIRFQTISHESSQALNAYAVDNFQAWVRQTYRKLHQSQQLRMFNGPTLYNRTAPHPN